MATWMSPPRLRCRPPRMSNSAPKGLRPPPPKNCSNMDCTSSCEAWPAPAHASTQLEGEASGPHTSAALPTLTPSASSSAAHLLEAAATKTAKAAKAAGARVAAAP